jgi:hypothetical protein
MKLYYKNHDVNSIYGLSIDGENESKFFGIFNKGKRNNKKYIMTQEDLLNVYQKRLSKLIDITPLIEQKNEKSFELLKSIFILLINYTERNIDPLIHQLSRIINKLIDIATFQKTGLLLMKGRC